MKSEWPGLTAAVLAFCAVTFLSTKTNAQVLRDSLAPTPPMGWNSWNKFACNVNEDLIKSVADSIATAILSRRLAAEVTVTVKKFSVPRSQYVAVEIHRAQ